MFYPCFCSEKDFDQNILEYNLNLIVVVITQGTRAWRLPFYPPFSLVYAVIMVVIVDLCSRFHIFLLEKYHARYPYIQRFTKT